MEQPDHNLHSVGVGGWVVGGDGRVLLVRMTYGPSQGRLMIPGGHAEPGEPLDQTACREVREETGVTAVARGILLVRQRIVSAADRNLYFVFLMTPTDSPAAVADGQEVSEAVWLLPAEIAGRDDVQPIAAELAAAFAAAPGHCLSPRPLAWQPAGDYWLWAGMSSAPPG